MQIAVAVVRWQDFLLVGVRPEGSTFAGMWEFPGGKVEPGETFRNAALRECREETGIHVRIIGEYAPATSEADGIPLEIRFFRCKMTESDLPEPLPPFRWMPAEEISADKFPPANKLLIEELLAGLLDY